MAVERGLAANFADVAFLNPRTDTLTRHVDIHRRNPRMVLMDAACGFGDPMSEMSEIYAIRGRFFPTDNAPVLTFHPKKRRHLAACI
jgi:hypothetical protein